MFNENSDVEHLIENDQPPMHAAFAAVPASSILIDDDGEISSISQTPSSSPSSIVTPRSLTTPLPNTPPNPTTQPLATTMPQSASIRTDPNCLVEVYIRPTESKTYHQIRSYADGGLLTTSKDESSGDELNETESTKPRGRVSQRVDRTLDMTNPCQPSYQVSLPSGIHTRIVPLATSPQLYRELANRRMRGDRINNEFNYSSDDSAANNAKYSECKGTTNSFRQDNLNSLPRYGASITRPFGHGSVTVTPIQSRSTSNDHMYNANQRQRIAQVTNRRNVERDFVTPSSDEDGKSNNNLTEEELFQPEIKVFDNVQYVSV